MTNSEKALEEIADGMVVGLGTGKASTEFIKLLGAAVQRGLNIRGVPTSQKSADLAVQLGIPLLTLEEAGAQIDVTVDGADEFDDQLNLVKGLGGALVREKIVAAASARFVVLVGPDNMEIKRAKRVIGERGVLPVEIVPFALPLVRRKLVEINCPPTLRLVNDQPFVTDNGNYIFDCQIQPLDNPRAFEQSLLDIPGVVGTGLFLGMADLIIAQTGDEVVTIRRT